MKYKISLKAEQDLESIWLYTIENWSQVQAKAYLNLIFKEIEFASEHPLMCPDASHLRKYYRYTRVKSHLIFFRYYSPKRKIEIVRILHSKSSLDNLLQTKS